MPREAPIHVDGERRRSPVLEWRLSIDQRPKSGGILRSLSVPRTEASRALPPLILRYDIDTHRPLGNHAPPGDGLAPRLEADTQLPWDASVEHR